MPDLPNPESRVEQYLANLTDGTTEIPKEPESRIEQYLDYLAKNGGAGVNYGTAPAAAAGMALVAKTIVDGKVTEWEFGDAGGLKIHICTSSEYGQVSREPVISSPDEKTLYLVPAENGSSPDLFVEWAYVNGNWEMFGSASIGSIPDSVNEWLTEHITNPDNPPLDRSLTSSSAAAPADLVGEELTNLKQDLSKLEAEKPITDYSFTQGTINASTGANGTSSSRCRTGYITFSNSKMIITPKEGYKVGGRTYSNNSGTYVSGESFSTEGIVYTDSTKYYRLLIAKSDDSNITPSDLPDDVITINEIGYTDKSLTLPDKCADSKATGDKIAEVKYLNEEKISDVISTTGNQLIANLINWRKGTINESTGAIKTTDITNRCYTHKKYRFDAIGGKVTINIDDGYSVCGREYKISDDSYIGVPFPFTEQTVTFYTNSDCYYRFVIRKTDDTDLSYQDLTDEAVFVYQTLNDSLDIVTRNNKVETISKLQQLNRKTRTSQSSFGKKPLCFIHFSDIHGDRQCLKNVIEFRNEYESYIDEIIHTGDTVDYESEDGIEFWDSVNGSEKILNTIGNHDTRASDNWTGLSMDDTYDMYFAPYISNWGDVQHEAKNTYYYKDYTEEGVRLIVLDIMHQTADQLTWFEGVLSDAITEELDVIVAVHSRAHWLLDSYDSVWDDKINSPSYSAGYSDTSSYTGTSYPSNLSNDYADAVDTFIEGGGEFVCWLHGHTHFRILAQLETHPNQLDLAVANAGGDDYASTYVWERVIDTKSMDDFNVVGIDTSGKILRVAKIGVNCDRYMRIANTLSYNYHNREIIYDN